MTDEIQEIRRTLQNLLPGSRYSTRVRALNEFGQYSPWSEALEFTAEGSAGADYDLITPAAPGVLPLINALAVVMDYTGENDGISLYVIEHSPDNELWQEIARSQIGIYIHQVPPGQTHYYRFSVIDLYGTQSPISPSNSGQSVSALSHKPYASVVVASSTSTAPGAENADFICDGTDDEITIAAAAASIGGEGKVLLLEGTYNLSDRVTEYATTFEGMGIWATKINMVGDSPVDSIFQCENLSGMWIAGNGHDVDGGYVVRAYQAVSDVYIEDFLGTNYVFTKYLTSSTIMGGDIGAVIASGGNASSTEFINCEIGVEIDSSEASVVGSSFDACTNGVVFNSDGVVSGCFFNESAIEINSSAVVVTGNTFDSTVSGIFHAINDGGDSAISGNKFYQCGIESRGGGHISGNSFFLQAGGRALTARAGSWTSFVSNKISHGSHAGAPGIPPIRIDNSTEDALITGNSISVYGPTGAFSDAGVNTSYGAGNQVNGVWVIPSSFETESDKFYEHNQGSGSATWTIAHNLAKYPSVVTVDGSGVQIFGTVTYDTANQVTVTFASGTPSGKAYCN